MNYRVSNVLRKMAFGPAAGVNEREQERRLKRLRELLTAEQLQKYRKYAQGTTNASVLKSVINTLVGAGVGSGLGLLVSSREGTPFSDTAGRIILPAQLGLMGAIAGFAGGGLLSGLRYQKGKDSAAYTKDARKALIDRVNGLSLLDSWSAKRQGELDALIAANTPIYYDETGNR